MSNPDDGTWAGARRWAQQARARLRSEGVTEQPVALRRYPLPRQWGISLHFRDEPQRATGSLKHHLVRRLLEDAVARGDNRQGTTVVESTAGNTAVVPASQR